MVVLRNVLNVSSNLKKKMKKEKRKRRGKKEKEQKEKEEKERKKAVLTTLENSLPLNLSVLRRIRTL